MDYPFTSHLAGRDTWVIHGAGCDCYLLLADEEAVMIDAGCSTASIREYAQSLTGLPVRRVVNTHSHFDHTGGNGYFEAIYGTAGIAKSAKNTMGEPPSAFPLNYDFTLVSHGDVIDIKGRPLRVIELNCHSPGDIVLLDETRRLLFCGDEVEAGQVLLLPGYAEKTGQIHAAPAASVEGCRAAMLRMKKEAAHFDCLCPAHNGTPIDPVYLDWYVALCDAIMDGSLPGSADLTSQSYSTADTHYPFEAAGYRRASHQGASLIYNASLIFERDRAGAASLHPATPLHLISSCSI